MKLLKNAFVLLFVVAAVCFAAGWTGTNTEPTATKIIDGKKYYVISKADEMAWFANQVNSGNSEINGILKNDISFGADSLNVSSTLWTPIGKDSLSMYNGIFDGDGHCVYGALVESRFGGFFGVTGDKAKIKNITIGKSTTLKRGSSYLYYAGGLVAVNNGVVEDVRSYATFSAFDSVKVSNFKSVSTIDIGGIAGVNNGTIKSCVSYLTVADSVFLFFTYNYDMSLPSSVSYKGTFNINTGGITGENNGFIEFCQNNSFVSSTFKYRYRYTDRSSSIYTSIVNLNTGGISGINNHSILNSVNYENVKTTYATVGEESAKYLITYHNLGGLVGDNLGTLKNSFSLSTSIVSENETESLIPYSSRIVKIGGICASCNSTPYAYFDFSILPNASTSLGKNTEEMQIDEFAWILNSTNGTEENSKVWSRYDGYPIFANDSLFAIQKITFDDGENTSASFTNYKGVISKFPGASYTPEGKAFAGWVDADGNVCDGATVFTADQTLTASFLDWEDVLYTVQFLDENGKLLDKTTVHSGETPVYSGSNPVKQETKAYTYSFAKWSPDLSAVTWHTDFIALFDSTLKQYKITYNDFDGKELFASDFDYGTKPSYSTIPSRPTTDQYIYTFTGWNPAVELVSGIATYTAQYDSTLREYAITFKNGDETLSVTDYAYGVKPSYSGKTPTKVATKQYSYTFKGWKPEIAAVSKDATYEAVFDSTLNKYSITFTDGIKILQSSDGDYGSMPDYTKSEPIKESSSKYDYKFKAWTPSLAKITDDATYTAVFDSTIRKFEVSFVNGKTTLQSGKAEYGSMPSYSGDEPTKKASEGYTYSFAGWEPTITSVNKDVIYKAVFDSTAKKFKVVFMNGKDTLQSSSVEYNVLPKYNGKEPKKDKTKKYTYTFAGWDKTIVAVTENAVYKAVFDSTETQGIALTSASNGGFMVSSIGNKQIAIQGIVAGKKFHVMDMQGRIIVSGKLALSNVVIPVYSAGTYIVQVENSIKMVNVK